MPARDGSTASLFDVDVARTPGVVPSLHQLCCEFIGTAVINLDNAPSILEFAHQHNVSNLLRRAERFVFSRASRQRSGPCFVD